MIYLTHTWNPNPPIRVNLAVMAMKRISTLPRTLELEPHH